MSCLQECNIIHSLSATFVSVYLSNRFKVKVTWGDGWENEFTQLSDFSDYSQPSASGEE